MALKAIEARGFSAESIPDSGVNIPLRRIESTEWGGVDEEVTAAVHPENSKIAVQAATLFGLHVAGIDIISPDITQPWFTNGAIINEVNFAPLLGGADISRSHIPAFFAEFMDGTGKIPIEFFETDTSALDFQQQQTAQGKRCYIVSADRCLDESGNEIFMPFKDARRRVKALTLRNEVDAIAVCSQPLAG